MNTWRPTASLLNLQRRAQILATIRTFFAERNVLEVETPLLGYSTATDPHISSLIVPHNTTSLYLQTSPEFAMKRLLVAGSGSIYQIAKAFRAEENGRLHHTEFTLLEWYRVGFDHHQLMDEMDALLQQVLQTESAERCTYTEIFQRYLEIDPLLASSEELAQCAYAQGLIEIQNPDPKDDTFWCHLLMSHCIEPNLGKERPLFVLDFPPAQAALAKIRPGNPPVAERFEVYYRGVELANGYHELNDILEQKRRFFVDNQRRETLNLPQIPADPSLLAALAYGLPDCAGVALGVDRLVMLALGASNIAEVMSL